MTEKLADYGVLGIILVAGGMFFYTKLWPRLEALTTFLITELQKERESNRQFNQQMFAEIRGQHEEIKADLLVRQQIERAMTSAMDHLAARISELAEQIRLLAKQVGQHS